MTERERKVCSVYTHDQHWVNPFDKEADFLCKAIEMGEMLGSCVVRQAFATKRGVADLILCYKGSFVAAELKDRDGRPSRQQLAFVDKVKRAGGKADIVDNLHDFFWLLVEGK